VPDPPLVIAPLDAGINLASVTPSLPSPATSEYLDLLRAIDTVEPTPDREKVAHKAAFDQLRELADPRAADGLAAYLEEKPKPRWRTQAAISLGEIGDLRAVPHLAWRLEQDPLKLYDPKSDPELRQDDRERIDAARVLADLVVLHPDKQEEIGRAAEPAIFAWLKETPQPHANAMRFLALSGSPAAIAKLRAWADPAEPLPKNGAMTFPPAFTTAQAALRYLGLSQHGRKRDDAVWALLAKQLGRRPAAMDATTEALLQGAGAVKGMSVRALTIGAVHGLAELGDPKAAPLLVAFVEEQKNNEQARYEACFALASIASVADLKALADKVKDPAPSDPKKELIRACFLESLTYGQAQGVDVTLLALVEPRDLGEVRNGAAVAIGLDGVDELAAKRLLGLLLPSGDVRVYAALALLLGGTQAQAAAAVDAVSDASELDALKVAYRHSFGRYTESHRERGAFARWVANAEACSAEWPRQIVSRGLHDVRDVGPGSLTRVVLRGRLLADARSTDAKKKSDAVLVLQAMGERGTLASLGAPSSGRAHVDGGSR
jgi:HEAT repeat protein